MWPDRAILADQIIIMTPGFDLLQNSDLQQSPVIDNQFRVMYLARDKQIGEELTYIEPRPPDREKVSYLIMYVQACSVLWQLTHTDIGSNPRFPLSDAHRINSCSSMIYDGPSHRSRRSIYICSNEAPM